MMKILNTPMGDIPLPCFIPVTTFGNRFPLDAMVQPYINRLSPVMMVSHFYAQEMEYQHLPIFIDSGGFASLFKGSEIYHIENGTHGIRTKEGSTITPESVLAFQEEKADIAATLDFIIGPDMPPEKGRTLQEWTIENAIWAVGNRKRENVNLFASLQAWDRESMIYILEKLLAFSFDGFALGGMVSRIRTPKIIFELVKIFRELEPNRPLHIFGVGSPRLVKALFDYGVSSVDSSNYVRQAASKRYLLTETGEYMTIEDKFDPAEICPCPICRQFSGEYFRMEGELNNMALALHNLAATILFLNSGGINGSGKTHIHTPEQAKRG